jgi:dihydropyrimidine dehydrogenase (NAD+) subunit PreT
MNPRPMLSDVPAGPSPERFPELHPPLHGATALAEANRCLYCFNAPCMTACPTHIDVPRFIKKIATGNLRGSALTILDANILGLSCARVCPVEVLCEGACVMIENHQPPIEIARLQRHAMESFYASNSRPFAVAAENGTSVACVGGGPASLACAAELRRRGVRVTIFDNRPLPGGLNTYAIAEYKLRAIDALREVELVRSLGVEFRRADVGGEITLEGLEKEFSLVFLGIGLGAMQRLSIPGENLGGVVDALRFIERYKTVPDFRVERRVVIIGGGNTAVDAANAARRLGAEEVHLFYRRTEHEMPAFQYEFDRSKVEGVRFHWLAQPTKILGYKGRVTGVTFQTMKPGPPDESGRRTPIPVDGEVYRFSCEMVIPALGQSRLTAMLGSRGIETAGGAVVVQRQTGRTSHPKYYAGGDCVNGGREVVDAVADGKRAAVAMLRELEYLPESNHG